MTKAKNSLPWVSRFKTNRLLSCVETQASIVDAVLNLTRGRAKIEGSRTYSPMALWLPVPPTATRLLPSPKGSILQVKQFHAPEIGVHGLRIGALGPRAMAPKCQKYCSHTRLAAWKDRSTLTTTPAIAGAQMFETLRTARSEHPSRVGQRPRGPSPPDVGEAVN